MMGPSTERGWQRGEGGRAAAEEPEEGVKAPHARARAGEPTPEVPSAGWSLPPAQPVPAATPPPTVIVVVAPPAPQPEAPRPRGHGLLFPPPADPERETLRGLGKLRHATLVAIIAACVTTAVGFFALSLYLDPSRGASIYELPPALGLQLSAFLLQVIAAGLGWSAFEEIVEGAPPMGVPHERDSRRSLQLVHYAVAAWFVGGITAMAVSGAYLFNALTGRAAGQPSDAAYLALISTLALTGVAVNTLLAVAMQGLIGKLMRAAGRARRRLFFSLALGGTFASAAVSLYCVAVLHGPDLYALLAVVSAASLAVYLVQIGDAEAGARVLARTHGSDPDAPLPSPEGSSPHSG